MTVGDNVIISYYVYTTEKRGHKELWNKFGYHNLTIDKILTLPEDNFTGFNETEFAIVSCFKGAAMVPLSYLNLVESSSEVKAQ